MTTQKKNPKHQNQVRIIGGHCRGRKITFAAAEGLRPTPDMVRERLFNWLGQDLTGQTVLDLFAGSGALGLEAASRNAKQVVMVENNRQTAQNLKQNTKLLGLAQTETAVSDGLNYLSSGLQTFDVVFLDPPFAWNRWQELFGALQGRLKKRANIYLEAGILPALPDYLTVLKEGKSGKSRFLLLENAAEDSQE